MPQQLTETGPVPGSVPVPAPASTSIFIVLLFTFVTGCTSARMSNSTADGHFRSGRYVEAAEVLKKEMEELGPDHRDRLLYLMDIGISLHSAGEYKESTKYFLEADKIAEIKDYTSLVAEGATLITSENMTDYKGEDFEKVLINAYLAINFTMLGEYEDALVEAKLVNRKLHRMVTEGEKNYKQNAFVTYLSGLLYEINGEFDNAYIDYKKVRQLAPTYPGLGKDLWRLARLTRSHEDAQAIERDFKLSSDDKGDVEKIIRKTHGEIIVLYENGISPIKAPNPNFNRVPQFFKRSNPVSYARVSVDGTHFAQTHLLHDIEGTAIQNLDDKYAGLIAKRIAGIVVKEVAAHQIEKSTNSPLLGFLARVLFHVSDQPDLRSWNFLPKDFQVARLVVPDGEHRIVVTPLGAQPLPDKVMRVQKGKKAVVNVRFTP